MDQEPHLQSLG